MGRTKSDENASDDEPGQENGGDGKARSMS
jgi:hypothetical protein